MALAQPLEHRTGQDERAHLGEDDDQDPTDRSCRVGRSRPGETRDSPAQGRTEHAVDPTQAIDSPQDAEILARYRRPAAFAPAMGMWAERSLRAFSRQEARGLLIDINPDTDIDLVADVVNVIRRGDATD